MRAVRILVVGLGALLAGCVGMSCSSTGEAPYDAGTLPDAGSPAEDGGSTPDTATSPVGTDAGDATLPEGTDASERSNDDAGDSSLGSHKDAGEDAGRGADASDAASHEDASDGSEPDASDASRADASDASQGADASDAATEDASDASPDDAADGPAFDAATCSGFNLAGDAINGITATTSPAGVALNIVTTDPTQNPVSAADSVVVTATTSPIGVMEDISIGYLVDASTSPLYVAMSLVPTTGGSNQEWTGSIPPIAAGATVQFWVVGHDYCKSDADAGADYYSNGGNNYHYETQ